SGCCTWSATRARSPTPGASGCPARTPPPPARSSTWPAARRPAPRCAGRRRTGCWPRWSGPGRRRCGCATRTSPPTRARSCAGSPGSPAAARRPARLRWARAAPRCSPRGTPSPATRCGSAPGRCRSGRTSPGAPGWGPGTGSPSPPSPFRCGADSGIDPVRIPVPGRREGRAIRGFRAPAGDSAASPGHCRGAPGFATLGDRVGAGGNCLGCARRARPWRAGRGPTMVDERRTDVRTRSVRVGAAVAAAALLVVACGDAGSARPTGAAPPPVPPSEGEPVPVRPPEAPPNPTPGHAAPGLPAADPAAGGTGQAGDECDVDEILEPSCGVWWGASPWKGDPRPLEKAAGRPMDIVYTWNGIDQPDVPKDRDLALAAEGRLIHANIEARRFERSGHPEVRYRRIIEGDFDDSLTE